MSRKPRRSIRSVLAITPVIAGAMLLTSCITTETRWIHDEIPSDEWGVDAAQCRWEARRKAEKEAEEERAYSTNDALDDEQSVDSMLASVDRDKRARELFDRCMRSLGYVPSE